jgi:hypothetical protein
MDYARLLARNNDLTLGEVITLDRVQKKLALSEEEEKSLKSKALNMRCW